MTFQQNVLEKKHPNCKRQKLQQSDWNSAHCNELWAFAKVTSYSKWTGPQKKNRNTVRWQNLTGTKAYVPYRIPHILMRDNAVKIIIAVTVAIVITSNASTLIFKCDWTSPNKPKLRHNVHAFACITIRTNVNTPNITIQHLQHTEANTDQIRWMHDTTNALSHTYAINNAGVVIITVIIVITNRYTAPNVRNTQEHTASNAATSSSSLS